MSKIIGTQSADFDTKEGNHIKGTSIHLTSPIDPKRGKGEAVEKIFLSSAKLAELDFTPEVGNDVEIFYNRYGKVASLKLIDDFID